MPLFTFLKSPSFWILSKYYQLEQDLEHNLKNYELAHNIDAIYRFLWDDFASWYVEYLKTANEVELAFAKDLFRQFVITASAYCPFETEVLWSQFFGESQLLANFVKDSNWTTKAFEIYFGCYQLDNLTHHQDYLEFETVIEFVTSMRSLRGLFAIDPVVEIQVWTQSPLLHKYQDFIKLVSKSTVCPQSQDNYYTVTTKTYDYKINILEYIKDIEWEIARTNKLIESLDKQIQALQKQLGNSSFVDNASSDIIQEKQSNLSDRQLEIKQQQDKLTFFGDSQ